MTNHKEVWNKVCDPKICRHSSNMFKSTRNSKSCGNAMQWRGEIIIVQGCVIPLVLTKRVSTQVGRRVISWIDQEVGFNLFSIGTHWTMILLVECWPAKHGWHEHYTRWAIVGRCTCIHLFLDRTDSDIPEERDVAGFKWGRLTRTLSATFFRNFKIGTLVLLFGIQQRRQEGINCLHVVGFAFKVMTYIPIVSTSFGTVAYLRRGHAIGGFHLSRYSCPVGGGVQAILFFDFGGRWSKSHKYAPWVKKRSP